MPTNPNITMRHRRRPLRDSDRFYTKSVKNGYDNLLILDNYNDKQLINLRIGETYKYCQSKNQLDRDGRRNQKKHGTLIEWYDGKHPTKKKFKIIDIKPGYIQGIIPTWSFNDFILTLERVE